MAVYKADVSAKNGNIWIFYVRYTNLDGKRKPYKSKKFATKKEAQEAERKFLISLDENINHSEMTLKELYLAFFEHQKDKVKDTTIQTYLNKFKYLNPLMVIKVKNFNIQNFEFWKKKLNSTKLGTTYKNDIYKFLKALLNYGSKWYNFNFTTVYNKMTNFTNPNEIKKEMLFYTYDEFKKFIRVEKEIKWICLFKTLYYCGLRKGELKGLIWNDIDFENKLININKNVVSNINGKKFTVTSPKTKSSNRILPIPDSLLKDIKELYKTNNSLDNFNNNYYVFNNKEPVNDSTILSRKLRNCRLANIKKIRIHDFRHSCASLLINNGANITLVAKYLGHSKIDETLNTYSHMYKNKLDDIMNLINELDRKSKKRNM